MTNLIEDVGFVNPNSNSTWSKADGDKAGIYFGQLDPNWRENAQKVIDEQRKEMQSIEDAQRKDSLPKEIAILGGGALVLLVGLIIYKYKKK